MKRDSWLLTGLHQTWNFKHFGHYGGWQLGSGVPTSPTCQGAFQPGRHLGEGGGPAPLTAAFYEQFAHRSVCRLQFHAQEALTDIEMAQCVNVWWTCNFSASHLLESERGNFISSQNQTAHTIPPGKAECCFCMSRMFGAGIAMLEQFREKQVLLKVQGHLDCT